MVSESPGGSADPCEKDGGSPAGAGDEDADSLFSSQGMNLIAPLAQLVEQLTLNQWVPGSSP